MIRFINLGSQITLDETEKHEFALFDTVTDTFLEFKGYQVWESWRELKECMSDSDNDLINRILVLLPEWCLNDN